MGVFRRVWTLLFFCACGIGCSGPPAGDPESDKSVFMRALSTLEGEFLCEEEPDPDYRCVHAATGESWICKIRPDEFGTLDYHCLPDPGDQPPWKPPCPNFHQIGDQLTGLQCWDPPANYCREGCAFTESWFCRADGSKCCVSSCMDCYRCGWVEMTGCTVAGQLESTDPSVCGAILEALPGPVRDCLETGGLGPECQFIHEDPECQVDLELVVCPL